MNKVNTRSEEIKSLGRVVCEFESLTFSGGLSSEEEGFLGALSLTLLRA